MDDRAAIEAVVRRYVEEGPGAEISDGPLLGRNRVMEAARAELAGVRSEIRELTVERIDGDTAVVRLDATLHGRHVADGKEYVTALGGPVTLRRDGDGGWRVVDLALDGASVLAGLYSAPAEQAGGGARVAATCELHGDHADIAAACENTSRAPLRVRYASCGFSMGPLWVEMKRPQPWIDLGPGERRTLGAKVAAAERTALSAETSADGGPPRAFRFDFEAPPGLPSRFARAIRSKWAKQVGLTAGLAVLLVWGFGLLAGLGVALAFLGFAQAPFLRWARGSGAVAVAAFAAACVVVGVALVASSGRRDAWPLLVFGALFQTAASWFRGRRGRGRG